MHFDKNEYFKPFDYICNTMENDLSKIYSSSQMHMIQIAQSLLDEEQIESFYFDKQDSSYPVFGIIELYVHKNNALKASQIIQKLIDSE